MPGLPGYDSWLDSPPDDEDDEHPDVTDDYEPGDGIDWLDDPADDYVYDPLRGDY